MSHTLFSPIKLGKYQLKNRIFMAPMTRARCGKQGIPTDLVVQYYKQRATAGLIITEATAVDPRGDGWPGAPGIYTDEQEAGWEKVAKAVHHEGGHIFMQIFHMGPAVLSEYIAGQKPIAASPIAAKGEIPNSSGIPTAFETPEAMTVSQIKHAVNAFATAAKRAITAGFDGVEVHAGNSFLIDSFLRDGTNKRDDAYGGSIENRCRFLFEVVNAVTKEIGADKVGVRFSPTNAIFGISDSDPAALFTYATKHLSTLDLAYLHILEPANGTENFMTSSVPNIAPLLKKEYSGLFILNGALNQENGQSHLTTGTADAIAFGMPFIANPDLVFRYQHRTELASPDQETFYTDGEEGYTTYKNHHDL